MGNPQVTIPVEPTQVDPRSIEWRDRRFFEIEQQLAGDYERSGMSPDEAAAKARQRVEEYALSQSTMFNTAQTRGGPVTVVQPGKPMPRQIGTVVGEQLVDPFGRPKVDRSGEPKRETRAIYEPPSGAVLASSPAVTRSQSLGKTATVRGSKTIAKGRSTSLMPKLGPISAGLAIGGALLSDNPAEAIPVAAETLTPLGDLQGAPEPVVTMVNVGGKLRPLNTDTNTLMDKPGYGLEQKGGQWREVQRGTGTASKQQSRVQAEQLIPTPKPVMANTPTGVAQLKAMPKSKNIDLINEAQYFIVNPVRSAFDRIFGKRDI